MLSTHGGFLCCRMKPHAGWSYRAAALPAESAAGSSPAKTMWASMIARCIAKTAASSAPCVGAALRGVLTWSVTWRLTGSQQSRGTSMHSCLIQVNPCWTRMIVPVIEHYSTSKQAGFKSQSKLLVFTYTDSGSHWCKQLNICFLKFYIPLSYTCVHKKKCMIVQWRGQPRQYAVLRYG